MSHTDCVTIESEKTPAGYPTLALHLMHAGANLAVYSHHLDLHSEKEIWGVDRPRGKGCTFITSCYWCTLWLLWLLIYCEVTMVTGVPCGYYGYWYTVRLLWLLIYCEVTMVTDIQPIALPHHIEHVRYLLGKKPLPWAEKDPTRRSSWPTSSSDVCLASDFLRES